MNAIFTSLRITKENGDMSQVIVSRSAFRELVNPKTTLASSLVSDADGKPVRAFDIDGVKLYSHYTVDDEGKRSTKFVMKTADARAMGATSFEEKLAFAI